MKDYGGLTEKRLSTGDACGSILNVWVVITFEVHEYSCTAIGPLPSY